jgi:hypothetical protein
MRSSSSTAQVYQRDPTERALSYRVFAHLGPPKRR